jgi:hypothetical protein
MQKREKKQGNTNRLTLRKETLRLLEGSELRAAIGGARIHIPIGYADDTTPFYNWVDVP